MLRRVATGLAGILLLAAVGLVGARGAGPLPPLGPLLDPAGGVWAAARTAAPPADRTFPAGLVAAEVRVVVDDRGVPHIYAASEQDAHRVLGFLVARDRLFQLELQTRAAAGTLTELLGERALQLDRQTRRLGFGRLVEQRLAAADTTTEAYRAVAAYAEGVNSWLATMRPADIPIEYRLLGRRPAPWRAANTYLLFARMSLTLAYNDASLLKARAAALVGWPAADALFPVNGPIYEPIQPRTPDQPRVELRELPPPGRPDTTALPALATLDAARRALGGDRQWSGDAVLGSNNWAVSPGRTAAGFALLAGDPHLELTLPSIWYQAHLVVPDRLDVAGVTLPGAPSVVIGFNRSIAWSMTNTSSDVNDFFREDVDSPASPTRYRVDGRWRDLELRVEVFRGPDGSVLAVDTVRYTHRGPLWQVDSSSLSMAWTVYQPHDDGAEFIVANRARSVSEFLEAMAGYVAPAQNMAVADRRGTIAIRSTGAYPIRPAPGRGDLILDGTRSASDWTGNLPLESYPFSLNPPRGFLSSANQQPVDPEANPRYLGANWYAPWRALRINALLRADSAATPDAMRRYQIDAVSAAALAFLPYLRAVRLAGADAVSAVRAREILNTWDGSYHLDREGAVLFDAVLRELRRATWDELATADGGAGPRPSDAVLLGLLADRASIWWDDRRTDGREDRDDILAAALGAGFDSTLARYGPPGPAWAWGNTHSANIHHLLRLAPMSALGLRVPWGTGTLSPSSGSGLAGASWRMVVELGPRVRAFATYPGGQSGNPVSRHYRDLLPVWQAGELDSLLVPATPDSFPAGRVESRFRFPGRR